MSNKAVPLSVRISENDAAFLAGLNLPDATTPSDKIRGLIWEARQRHQGGQVYGDALQFQEDLLTPFIRRLREAESETRLHSELLFQLLRWMPETIAYVTSHLPAPDAHDIEADLEQLEGGVIDRVMILMDAVLRMAVSRHAPCYDSLAIGDRIWPILELASMVESTGANKTDGGGSDDQ